MTIATGSSLMTPTVGGTLFDVYCYKPTGTINGLLIIFHGTSRTADNHRDYGIDLARRAGLIVIAPLFDSTRFPTHLYHQGGLETSGGAIETNSANWTTHYPALFAEWVRTEEASPALPYWLLGHSAGAQYLSRVAAFARPAARRIVVANASTHVRPLLGADPSGEAAPYGMGGVWSSPQQDSELAAYLQNRVTIFCGTADNDPADPDLATGPAAMRQGTNRYDRGDFIYNEGVSQAASVGVTLGWRFVAAADVTHTGYGMLHSRSVFEALGIFPLAPRYRLTGQTGTVSLKIRHRGYGGSTGDESTAQNGTAL